MATFMPEPREHARETRPGDGFTVLDGAALVIGSAVASVHLRGPTGEGLMRGAWLLFWITFVGVALTSAGPFVFLARRFGRRPDGYPKVWDRLWALLGAPWVLASVVRVMIRGFGRQALDFYALSLWVSIGAASLLTVSALWKTSYSAAPKSPEVKEPTPWTTYVGLILSVAWPLQLGFGMVIAQ
jgi:hypothetical protein